MDETQQCLRCGREAAWAEATCLACGTTLTVDLRLLALPAEPRARYALAKQLSGLTGLNVDLPAQLKARAPVLAERVTRAKAAEVGALLSAAGLEFEILPRAASAPPPPSPERRGPLRGLLLGVLALALAGAGVVEVLRRARSSPGATPEALLQLSRQSWDAVKEATEGTVSLKQAVQSVVSVRCGRSMGSGFFVGPHTIVTNHHVLCPGNADPRVVLPSGLEGTASVVDSDEKHDLALLSTELTGRALPLGDAAAADVGSQVAIIGNPQGLDFTVHRGTLSFVGRATGGVGYLQVDAAINPGNSGGPVLDARGRVIGVVNAKLLDAAGIGFAVPANYLVSGARPLWREGPRELLSEAWADFDRRTAASEGTALTGPRPAAPETFDALLARARWTRWPRAGAAEAPEIEVVVVTTDAEPNGRRWLFQLMDRDQPLCDLLRARTLAWIRLESTDPNLDPRLVKELLERHLDRKLFVGAMALQWSRCPEAYSRAAAQLALSLPGAPRPYDRVGIKLQ